LVGAGRTIADLMLQHRVDLIMLHFFGSADADEIVLEALRSGTPFAVLNHFSNDQFLSLSIRKHTMLASGVAGVNGLGLPRFVRKEFCNLSDGIDTDFFQPSNACPVIGAPTPLLVLLPARVVWSKGHLDLIKAAGALRRDGIEFAIGFAGRADSPSFTDRLRHTIGQSGLVNQVHFLGELSVERLRDWYGASALVAFPTYHHEGLPRVSLEAQAMQVPIIAYATGGVAEGISSGRTGYLVKTGDIEGLGLRLRELLVDARKRNEMGKAGRRWVVERFSLGALAQRHEQFYLRVIASQGTGPSPIKS
jgi:glycosyltransferase involved in cell wall biosynthesis